jgi:hypothetical protein
MHRLDIHEVYARLKAPAVMVPVLDRMDMPTVRGHLLRHDIAWDVVICGGVRYEVWLHEHDHSGTDWMTVDPE